MLCAGVVAVAIVTAVVALVRLDTTGEKGSGLGKEFVYDIEALTKVDPSLIIYEESGNPILTGFTQSSAIAVAATSASRIYAAGDNSVRLFSEEGRLVDEIKLTGSPRCLAIGADGNIYVGMKDHVEVYEEGKQSASWPGLGSRAVITSIAVYKNNVFVADAGNRVVIRYDTGGKIVNHVGAKDKDKGIGGFLIPSPYFDLAVASDGLLRVVNPGRHLIEAYTFEGDLEFSWGKSSAGIEGFCGCCNPINFAMLDDDSFITCEKGLTRVKHYDADGKFVGVVAGPEQLVPERQCRICNVPSLCQSGGFDVAVGTGGQVFILDTVKNIVRTFTKKTEEQQ
jgi:hypothetical protein